MTFTYELMTSDGVTITRHVRDVTPTPAQQAAIDALAEQLEAEGCMDAHEYLAAVATMEHYEHQAYQRVCERRGVLPL